MLSEKAKTRTVHLPAGDWVHFWTGEVFAGGKKYRVNAPMGETPVFYRKNSAFAPVFKQAGEIK